MQLGPLAGSLALPPQGRLLPVFRLDIPSQTDCHQLLILKTSSKPSPAHFNSPDTVGRFSNSLIHLFANSVLTPTPMRMLSGILPPTLLEPMSGISLGTWKILNKQLLNKLIIMQHLHTKHLSNRRPITVGRV